GHERIARARKEKTGRFDDLRRLPLLLQWSWKASFPPAEPRCGICAETTRPVRPGRIFLQRRNRPHWRKEFSAQLHRLACAVCKEVITIHLCFCLAVRHARTRNAGETTNRTKSSHTAAKSGRWQAAWPPWRTRARPASNGTNSPSGSIGRRAGIARTKNRSPFLRHQPGD